MKFSGKTKAKPKPATTKKGKSPQPKGKQKEKKQDTAAADVTAQIKDDTAADDVTAQIKKAKEANTNLLASTASMIWKKGMTGQELKDHLKEASSQLQKVTQLALSVPEVDRPSVEDLQSDLEKQINRVQLLVNLFMNIRKPNVATRILSGNLTRDIMQAIPYMDVETAIDVLKLIANKLENNLQAMVETINMDMPPSEPGGLNFGVVYKALARKDEPTSRAFLQAQREFMNKYYDSLRTAKGPSAVTSVFSTEVLAAVEGAFRQAFILSLPRGGIA